MKKILFIFSILLIHISIFCSDDISKESQTKSKNTKLPRNVSRNLVYLRKHPYKSNYYYRTYRPRYYWRRPVYRRSWYWNHPYRWGHYPRHRYRW